MSLIDSYIGSWTDNDLRTRMTELPNYTSLVICGPGFTDEGAELLTLCTNLKELQLVGTSITDAGLRFISELTNLDWLVIDRASVTDSGLSLLTSLKKLKGLQLISTGASDEGFQTLRYLPKLTYLEATDHYLRRKELRLISELPNLSSLRLASDVTEDPDFLNLTGCRSLELLSFDMPLVTKGAIEDVKETLLHCHMQPAKFFRRTERISFLSSYCFELYDLEQYDLAWIAANDVLDWFPFNPAAHGTRALINFQMGNVPDFRKDLENARVNANLFADGEVFRMADRLLSIQSIDKIKIELQDKLLRDILLDRMRGSIQSSPEDNNQAKTKMMMDRFRKAVASSNSVYRRENERKAYYNERAVIDFMNAEMRKRKQEVEENRTLLLRKPPRER